MYLCHKGNISNAPVPSHHQGSQLRVFGDVSKNCRVQKYQTCLIIATTVTDPLLSLPTNFPVSGFPWTPQTQINTIVCCLRHPATLNPWTHSPRRPGLSPRPQQKSPVTVSVNRLLVPGLRKPQSSLRPSRYIPRQNQSLNRSQTWLNQFIVGERS